MGKRLRRDTPHDAPVTGQVRRRNDPATGEIDLSDAEREFALELDRYKRIFRRPFPCCHEVLEVLHAMGYRKVAPAVPLEKLPRLGIYRATAPPAIPPPSPHDLADCVPRVELPAPRKKRRRRKADTEEPTSTRGAATRG